jgi:hypothetical protein
MMLLEKAEGLDKDAPDAAEIAHSIMDEFEECLSSMRSEEVRERYDGFRPRFVKMLRAYLK